MQNLCESSARIKASFDQIARDWIHCDDSENFFSLGQSFVNSICQEGRAARWTERNEFFSFLAIRRRFPVRDLIQTYIRLCHFRTEADKLYYRRSLSELSLSLVEVIINFNVVFEVGSLRVWILNMCFIIVIVKILTSDTYIVKIFTEKYLRLLNIF